MPRSSICALVPLDLETIAESVRRTGRCVIVHEATLTSGYGAELATLVQDQCFYHLEAPIRRVTGWDMPYPARLAMRELRWAMCRGPVPMVG